MMKERLVIKNFGPIKSVDLELGKMTILIGEQATGKSTIAKVLAVCRYFSYIYDATVRPILGSSFMDGLDAWGLKSMVNGESYIHYSCSDYNLEVKNNEEYLPVDYDDEGSPEFANVKIFTPFLEPKSDRFKKLLAELNSLLPKNENAYSMDRFFFQTPPSFYQNNVINVMDNPFFFPTERGLQSIFSLGKHSIQNLSDSLFNQFARLDQILRSYGKETEIGPLNIFYKTNNGEGFIRKGDEESYYSFRNAASGYQSLIPIVLAVKYYNEAQKRSRTFIVEEPELNLFPKAQKSLMEFFVESINIHGNKFLLPTHSPYVLSSLNNLAYAYKLGNINDGKYKVEVNSIIDEKFWIDINDISAYYLYGGVATDLVDREEALISIDELDSVSNNINKEFDQLLAIEIKYSNTDKNGL